MGALQSKEEQLWGLAESGNAEALKHPDIASLRWEDGNTPLHVLARTGCVDALGHPDVGTVHNACGQTPLLLLAKAGVREVLRHPMVEESLNQYGVSPLESFFSESRDACLWQEVSNRQRALRKARESLLESLMELFKLALDGKFDALTSLPSGPRVIDHPEVASPVGPYGFSALHCLATKQVVEVLAHPQAGLSRNWRGQTPLHILAYPRVRTFTLQPDDELPEFSESSNGFDAFRSLPEENNTNSETHPHVLKLLLEHPEVATARDWKGFTPLHWLCYREHKEALSHPMADVVRDNRGRSPKDNFGVFCWD